ncbi:tRNA (uridine(34)/cytosine(34)/5-carboxymethylaminomethyluridine(34)-2'-O)-methyltransferase TrmL [Paenibacillus sp.]|uniref:tRNA (uridine(34)/cytosine(34)/5- carboxymethylaminomethyluridine(34)-2'-O)- methyltransferase TrmL n=1 Tax=Paenibacillus sp. TaxID=58172 RepID=UPI002D409C5A|nr:tRNA (uridine(34)/cytosine(34)/5-carboxymethylaminomethyluridine(34)-2'-O)-methyltransferase TrmL [Paenibacillus sp.]HZG56858.1 tRNA (uridine(34)/cytosine(34)/5-carboxymethylaminomethyluridine(34)-2'-O)-methyltransferase TrmL [Paenibacillus sp.]
MAFHVVLVEPEIPANTGNISRTCAGTGTHLHLVKPLGFSIEDKDLKRAGLDYWPHVKLHVHESFEAVLEQYGGGRMFFATTKGSRGYTEFEYQDGDMFVFGRETKGLPDDILSRFPERRIRIPINDHIRSLNLSNSVAIVLYEALRQAGFPELVVQK